MSQVILHGAKPTDEERSVLRARVGRMHCVPLAAMYAAYVATCLMRGEVVEDMETFEARLRQYFALGSDPVTWADRPIIFEGIVYGVWFNDETRRFVVDLSATATIQGGARNEVNPPTIVDTMSTERNGMYLRGSRGRRRWQPDVSTRTISHPRQTASSNRLEPTSERVNA